MSRGSLVALRDKVHHSLGTSNCFCDTGLRAFQTRINAFVN